MPRGDGTGPQGRGPRTGRGLGPCPSDNINQTGLRLADRLAGMLRRRPRSGRGQGGGRGQNSPDR